MTVGFRAAHRLADRLVSTLREGAPWFGEERPSPPSVPGSLVLGNLVEGWNHPLALFTRCLHERQALTRLRFGASFYYLLHDPELIRHVLVENAKNYRKSKNYRGIKLVLGDGLFTSEGEHWLRQRRLAQPAFHRERLTDFAATMAQCTRDAIERLTQRVGEPVELDRALSKLALRIVCRTLFSADVDDDADAIGQAVNFANEFGESAYFLPTWVPTPKNLALRRALGVFDALVARMLAERRGGRAGAGVERDLLSMLMAAQDPVTGERMTDSQLRDEALTLIVGGHETTATVLSWTFYLLSRHPDVARKVRAQALEVLGERDPTPDDLPRLGYVTQVIQESMRLYPPAWVMERESLAGDQLGAYAIPPGATVAVSAYTLHRDPKYWSNPEGFDPERFAPAPSRERSKYVYLPFGAGPRLCIGNAFAMMETVIIVAMIARTLSLELVSGHPVEPEPLTTLRTKHGLPMVPRRA